MIDHAAAAWLDRSTYAVAPDASRFEMWESSIACRAGLAAAVQLCEEVGPELIASRSCVLARRLREGLGQIGGLLIRDAPADFDEDSAAALGASRCAIVTFDATAHGWPAQALHAALTRSRVAASVSPSRHTFDDSLWQRPPVVRLSPSYFNSEAEVDAVIAQVAQITSSPPPASRQSAACGSKANP